MDKEEIYSSKIKQPIMYLPNNWKCVIRNVSIGTW